MEKERSKLLPLIIKTFESGEYIGSKEILKLEKKLLNIVGQNMQFVQIQEQTL